MALQQGNALVLERYLLMMLRLLLDVGGDLRHIRLADAERPVTFLPTEVALAGKRLVNPF